MANNMALPTTDKKITEKADSIWVCPEFKVSGVFSSHMVLQRDKDIAVWGFSDTPGSKINGIFMGEEANARVGDDCKWVLNFCARPYCKEPQIMEIKDDRGHTAKFDDILIGDVWMIGGQSNAELNLAPCLYLTPDVTFSENDNFRLFAQTQNYVFTHQEYCNEPQKDIINNEWTWKCPGSDSSKAFSAVGWYFAKELIKHIDIPLGMIMMAAGGACIRELVPEALAEKMGYNFGANVCMSGYYNTLIYPFLPLPFKGMIFFQGESEGCERTFAERYSKELYQLVEDERRSFGFDFPFYNVQLSDYRTEGTQFFPWHHIVRAQQFNALHDIPDSTLTVDMDLGAPEGYEDWPHSPKKYELAMRVAKLALAKEYGIADGSEINSPMPVNVKISEDNGAIEVKFQYVGDGLCVSGLSAAESLGAEVQGFSCGALDVCVPVKAVIKSKDTIVFDVPAGADTSYVGYAMSTIITPENANLMNSVNLPCVAFMIEVKNQKNI